MPSGACPKEKKRPPPGNKQLGEMGRGDRSGKFGNGRARILSCSVTLEKKGLQPILFWGLDHFSGAATKKKGGKLEPLNN